MKNKFNVIFYILLLTPLSQHASAPKPANPTTLIVVASAAPTDANPLQFASSNNQPAFAQAAATVAAFRLDQASHNPYPDVLGVPRTNMSLAERRRVAQEIAFREFTNETCCLPEDPSPCCLCCWFITYFGCFCDFNVAGRAIAKGIIS